MSETFCPVPKPPARAKKPRKPLPRNTKPIARASWLKPSTTAIPKTGPRRQRREKQYKKFLGSAVWRAIRTETFRLADYACVLCGWEDESRTGVGLICDHVSYFRKLGQEIVGEDTRCLCKRCNERETTSKRANWAQPRRKTP